MNSYGEDWDKLYNYAMSQGIDVELYEPNDVPKEWENMGGIYQDQGNRIELYAYPHQSLANICLVFIHELGHYLDYVHSGYKVDDQTNAAYEKEANRERGAPPIPLEDRYYIYESECNGIYYMEAIWEVLKLDIPYNRIKVEQQLDIWSYKRYYLTGDLPTSGQLYEYRKQLSTKYSNWRRSRTRSKESPWYSCVFPELKKDNT